MKVNEQDFLRLVENANTLVFFDLESTGFRGDYNSILVGSILKFGDKKAETFSVSQPGNDQRVVREVRDYLESFDVWVTYYGKGFDIPMLNTRLLKWNLNPVEKRPHIDLFYTLKANLLTSRRSQSHLNSWLQVPEQKLTVSADEWNTVLYDKKSMNKLIERCESDVEGLRDLYNRTKHLIRDIKR